MKTGFHGPRSRQNAQILLTAAKELGYPVQVVKTSLGGYTAPQDVIDAALGIAGIEEGRVYPAPEEPKEKEAAEPLPRPNNGASREEWARYAKSVGVEVTDEDTRNGLIEKADALTKGSD